LAIALPFLTSLQVASARRRHSTHCAKARCWRNILAAIRGEKKKPFRFKTIGRLAAIGKRTGVARAFGLNFNGFVAWWLWRTIYLSKLPRFEKKLRVAIDWTLDLIFSKDLVQFLTIRSYHMSANDSAIPVHAEHSMTQVAGD
jgi:NADH dehydrogenase